MIIQCPKCLTKFKMDDSKVKDEGTKVRCAKCKEVFVVTKEEAAPALPPSAPELPTEKEEFDFSFGASAKEKEESGFGENFEEGAPKEEEAGFDFGAFSGGEAKDEGFEWGGMAYGEVNLLGSEEEKPSEQKEAASGFEFKEEHSFEAPGEAPSLASTVVIPPLAPHAEERMEFKEKAPGPSIFEEEGPLGDFEEGYTDEFAIEAKNETRRSFLRVVLSFIVICTVAAVPLWYFWKNYQRAETGEITLTDLNGYYTQNAEAGNVFVVSGKAVNNTNKARSFFQVRGILFSKKGEKLAQKEVYCGNIFTAKEVTTLPRAKIEADLKNKVGSSLSNINLATGKSVPFMIVFFDLPTDMSEFSVEVTGSQIASE